MKNTLKISFFMAALTGIFMIRGQLMGGQNGMFLALIMALGMNFFAYWFSSIAAVMAGGYQLYGHHGAVGHDFRRWQK